MFLLLTWGQVSPRVFALCHLGIAGHPDGRSPGRSKHSLQLMIDCLNILHNENSNHKKWCRLQSNSTPPSALSPEVTILRVFLCVLLDHDSLCLLLYYSNSSIVYTCLAFLTWQYMLVTAPCQCLSINFSLVGSCGGFFQPHAQGMWSNSGFLRQHTLSNDDQGVFSFLFSSSMCSSTSWVVWAGRISWRPTKKQGTEPGVILFAEGEKTPSNSCLQPMPVQS